MEETSFVNTDKLSRRRHEVNILRVESPLLFWVQLRTGEDSLKGLLEELEIHMARKGKYLSLWPKQIKEEEIIAVKEKEKWQRGLIVRVDQTRGMALIALADLGRTTWKLFKDLYFLEERFKKLSWQAIACGLAHIAPPAPTDTWAAKTRTLCRLLAEGEKGWIRIKYPLWPGAALVDLTIIGPKNNSIIHKTIHLKEALIYLGHAREEKDKVTVDTFPAV